MSQKNTNYSCAATGAASCRLAKLQPGERLACGLSNLEALEQPAQALLQPSGCRPSLEELKNASAVHAGGGTVACSSPKAALDIGCVGCQ